MKIDRSKRFVVTETPTLDFYDCPNCNYMWVVDEDKFCSNCGAEIEWTGIKIY